MGMYSRKVYFKSFMKKKVFVVSIVAIILAGGLLIHAMSKSSENRYKEIPYPTPNIEPDTLNEVKGVVLHHTAEPTVERSLAILTSLEKKVSSHIVVDCDGTRYVLASPTDVTWHAGKSILNGREGCNFFTIGIEFQGNTLEAPLTQDQIDSAIEYLLPIIKQYDIPIDNIVTHEMVRKAYKKAHPKQRAYDKPDITQTEYHRFMRALREAID